MFVPAFTSPPTCQDAGILLIGQFILKTALVICKPGWSDAEVISQLTYLWTQVFSTYYRQYKANWYKQPTLHFPTFFFIFQHQSNSSINWVFVIYSTIFSQIPAFRFHQKAKVSFLKDPEEFCEKNSVYVCIGHAIFSLFLPCYVARRPHPQGARYSRRFWNWKSCAKLKRHYWPHCSNMSIYRRKHVTSSITV